MKTIHLSVFFLLLIISIIPCCQSKAKPEIEHVQHAIPAKDTVIVPKTVELNMPCINKSFNLIGAIKHSASLLEGTPYSQENKTDCSGIFHKVINTLRDSCPEASLPTVENSRSTRDIAEWYYKNGKFKIIRDPNNSGHLIKPGAIMFYGYGDPDRSYDFANITIDSLITPNIGINHVAIVTDINVVNDRLESYEIFHGRNPSKPASITTSRRVYSYQADLPVYGNWKEPWLAVAEILGKEAK